MQFQKRIVSSLNTNFARSRPPDLPDLAALAVFARVVECGGFTAAARHLGLTKSAVSKQVQRLERETAAQLLQRTTRSVTLTEPGRVLYEHAEQILRLGQSARDAMARLAQRPSGILRMTASVTYGKHVLAPLLPEFFALYPEIRLALTLVDRHVDLHDEGYDLAIRLTEAPPLQLVGRRLHRCEFVLCAAPDFVKEHRVEQPADLAQAACLAFSTGSAGRGLSWHFTHRDGRSATVDVHGPVAVNSSDVVRELARRGMGFGLLPRFTVHDDLQAGTLLPVLPDWTPAGAFGPTAWALWSAQRNLLPKLRVMIDFLAARLDGAR